MKDKYDKCIEYLTENPEDVYVFWLVPRGPYGDIFSYVGLKHPCPQKGLCGCLTQISRGDRVATTLDGEVDRDLTAEIQADERIPKSAEKLTQQDLEVLAEWQRKLDKIYGGIDRTRFPEAWNLDEDRT